MTTDPVMRGLFVFVGVTTTATAGDDLESFTDPDIVAGTMDQHDTTPIRKISLTDAAEIVGCTTGLLRQYARDGRIPGAEKIAPRLWQLPICEVEKIRDTPHSQGRKRRRFSLENAGR